MAQSLVQPVETIKVRLQTEASGIAERRYKNIGQIQ